MTLFLSDIGARLHDIRTSGMSKSEDARRTTQRAHVRIAGQEAINLCANNHRGRADYLDISAAAKAASDYFGYPYLVMG